MGTHSRVPTRLSEGPGRFPRRKRGAAEAGRLCKMALGRSSEEHRDYFPGTKVASVSALELGKGGAHMND